MAASTKILTVSYGTFSCTLEGFDDSFHSMKAIAEYFRDLAHEDRYFGAEPPAPDAEMLAKIAEREISRRVEAQVDGKGIRLRADLAPEAFDDAVAMPPKAEAPVAQPTHESPSALMPAAPLMAATAEEDVAEAASAAPLTSEAPAHPDAASVAAKLQRIRAVVGNTAPTDEDILEDAIIDDDGPTLDDVLSAEPDVAAPAEDDEVAKAAEEAAQAEAEAKAAEEVAQAEAEAKAAEEAAQAEAEAKAAEEAAQSEAEAKAAEEAAQAEAEAKAAEEAAQAEAEAKAAEEAAQAEAEAKAAEEAAQAEAEAKAAEEAAVAPEDDLSSNLNDIDLPTDAPKAPVRARIVRLRKDKPAEVIAAPAEEAVETETDTDADIADRVTAALKSDAPAPDAASKVEAEAPQPTDVRAAVAAAIPAGTLGADDEDELLRELAAVSEDVVTLDDPQEPEVTEVVVEDVAETVVEDIVEDVVEAAPEMDAADVMAEEPEVTPLPEVAEKPVVSERRRSLPETDDAAMSRIMTQTDEALNEPTGSRRRNAIAQLKAAVAATEAARQLGDKASSEAEAQEAFREDLDQVVRPRRPSTPIETGDLRAERPRSTPLKLVASQRIDDGSEEPVAQRRRVPTTPLEAQSASGFAEFASKMGATELPDLLEAAAAYTSFVEGVEDFSRPQIMKKVQLTTDEEFSREDGLRSFGTLLRQGRISKVRNGRFQISEQTRFRPDARSA